MLIFLFVISALANAQTQYSFKSKYDNFTIEQSGSAYMLSNQKIDPASFKEFIHTFDQEYVDPCPQLPAQPDLVITKTSDEIRRRSFYIAARTIKSEKNCLIVQGNGIYYLPLHRDWFEKSQSSNLNIAKKVTFKLQDQSSFGLELVRDSWQSTSPQFFIDMDFFEKFRNSLMNYSIDLRLHPAIVQTQTQFVMKADGQLYRFIKVAENLWAVKKPKIAWLEASNSWSFWLDMSKTQWEDRYSSQVRFVLDKGKNLEDRKGALYNLKDAWSESIKRALHKILLDAGEKSELQSVALQMLRQKPSDDNFAIMIQALTQVTDREVLMSLSQTLRTRNSRGPIITVEMSEADKAKSIRQWQQWWRGQSHSKPSQ